MSGNHPSGGQPGPYPPGPNGPGQAGPGQPGPGQPGPGQSGPGQSGPGQSGPGSSGPGQGFGQPSGPGYGGPGGYPVPPQNPYYGGPGGPGPGGPGYGGPGGPGPGGPGPGGPGAGGPGPYGPGGTPPAKKSSTKLLLIIGAAALALIIVVVGAVAIFHRSASSAGSPADSQTSAAAPAATKASDAVKNYLEALAAGKADAALALSDEQAADKTFLTDAVLADSNSRAPITAIVVPDVDDEYAYSVDASYKLGSQAVSEKYSVKKAGDTWKVRDAFAEINLTYARSKTVPMMVNKVAVKTDKIKIFPGSYLFSSGNKNIGYGTDSTLLLTSPSQYPSVSDIKPTLTTAGSAAFLAAAKSQVNACVKEKVLAPAGCPFALRELSGQKIDTSSISWKLADDPFANLKPTIDYDNPALAKASGDVDVLFEGTGTSYGDKVKFGPQKVYGYTTMTANMTKTPIKVAFTD